MGSKGFWVFMVLGFRVGLKARVIGLEDLGAIAPDPELPNAKILKALQHQAVKFCGDYNSYELCLNTSFITVCCTPHIEP